MIVIAVQECGAFIDDTWKFEKDWWILAEMR